MSESQKAGSGALREAQLEQIEQIARDEFAKYETTGIDFSVIAEKVLEALAPSRQGGSERV